MRAVRVVGSLVLLLICRFAHGEVSTFLALMSDYRFRGGSLTDERPALQAGVNFDHASGLFAGAAASNVRARRSSGIGAVFYGGYAHPIDTSASWEIGLVTYAYPRPARGSDWDYTEGFIGASLSEVSARIYYSDDYYGTGWSSIYAEFNLAHPVTDRITLLAHIGYLRYLQRPRYFGRRGDPEQMDFKAGVALELAGFNLELSVTGTDASRTCAGELDHCGTAAVFSVSRTF